METKILEDFIIAGIGVRTSNDPDKAPADIPKLWQRFYSENISGLINDKAGEEIYAVYTEYASDFRGEYTIITGNRVNAVDNLLPQLTAHKCKGGKYLLFTAKGQMPDALINKWKEIWDNDKTLNRAYTNDFELYGPKSQDPVNPEIDIYIAVK